MNLKASYMVLIPSREEKIANLLMAGSFISTMYHLHSDLAA